MKRIKDLTTRGIGTYGIAREASVRDAAREFVDKRVSALIVYDDEKMVGIFTKNDLIRCCADSVDGTGGCKVGDYMKTDLFTTTVDADLDDVMEVMLEKGFRHVPVLDGDRPVGMVTSTDILQHQTSDLGREKEHLVRYVQGCY
jgi:CBS domain-containing protein